MQSIFDDSGRLIIPDIDRHLHRWSVATAGDQQIVTQAYCPSGHSLISDQHIDGHPALHFLYQSQDATRHAHVLISPIVGCRIKTFLSGDAFEPGEIVRVLCPICRIEMPILSQCSCGAPIHLFYMDRQFDHRVGQSFCARIGCIAASQLRCCDDLLRELENEFGT
jgi:hypothetical protein